MGEQSEDWLQGYHDGYHFRPYCPGGYDPDEYGAGWDAALERMSIAGARNPHAAD